MDGQLSKADERDLFNLANNFALRHNNPKQRRNSGETWLTWIFYVYLATIRAMIESRESSEASG